MNSRKGEITMNNVLAVIIAVIGIGLLAFAGFKLFKLYWNAESDNARNALDNILGKAEVLGEGESNSFLIQGFSKGGSWFLVGWGKGEEGRPDKCFFESCLCVCKNLDEGSVVYQPGEDYQEKVSLRKSMHGVKCQNEGFCRKVDAEKINLGQFDLSTNIHNGERAVGQKTYIKLSENSIEIPVAKSSLGINITFFGEGYKEENPDIETRYVYIS